MKTPYSFSGKIKITIQMLDDEQRTLVGYCELKIAQDTYTGKGRGEDFPAMMTDLQRNMARLYNMDDDWLATYFDVVDIQPPLL